MAKLREGSQTAKILADLMKGHKITAFDALADYGCMRLAARIGELRSWGHVIETEEHLTPTYKTVARYYIKKENR